MLVHNGHVIFNFFVNFCHLWWKIWKHISSMAIILVILNLILSYEIVAFRDRYSSIPCNAVNKHSYDNHIFM